MGIDVTGSRLILAIESLNGVAALSHRRAAQTKAPSAHEAAPRQEAGDLVRLQAAVKQLSTDTTEHNRYDRKGFRREEQLVLGLQLSESDFILKPVDLTRKDPFGD